MNRFLITGLITLFVLSASAQNDKGSAEEHLFTRPKLVVGIVVDQMRYDYIPRFWNKMGEGGFKRMIREGFNCKNNHFNYVPTYTGPGHASVYTGTTPAVHGIIGNDWYDKEQDRMVYCAGDDSVTPVGTDDKAGMMSPHRMKTSSITDQLRLATQMKGKVIGVSLKDRGSILPAGHAANAAYWFHGKKEGVWISSSYYMNELPDWVKKFNKAEYSKDYLKDWDTYYDIKTYVESGADDNDFEGTFSGEEKAVFPHRLKKIAEKNGYYDIIRVTPYGNNLTTDFALAAIDGEDLGADDITDFLAVSYSATDYVGHLYGVNSKEIEDIYIRLDRDLERMFNTLDKKLGKGNYTVFLTADHGAAHVSAYLQSVKMKAGYFNGKEFRSELNEFLMQKYGTADILKNISNHQLFLDHKLLRSKGLDIREVEEALAHELLAYDQIAEVYTGSQMRLGNFTKGIAYLIQRGFNHRRSGDIMLVLDPGITDYGRKGSTHGTAFNYDTHSPLIFFGKGIRQGETYDRTEITDIAPTMAVLLGIAFPNGASGNPVGQALE